MRRRNIKKIASATECGHDEVPVHDEWRWIGDHVLERIHNIPRREMFVPSDCEDCPCDHRFDSRLERNSIEVPVECEGGQKVIGVSLVIMEKGQTNRNEFLDWKSLSFVF